jgi:hypothetical protein
MRDCCQFPIPAGKVADDSFEYMKEEEQKRLDSEAAQVYVSKLLESFQPAGFLPMLSQLILLAKAPLSVRVCQPNQAVDHTSMWTC